ncbi:MAG: hypothetical protein JRN21_00025 [Nitrososphaerota archaeon]|nr:hypothetical protein [Nitrososphaerota archaeon]
MGEGSERPEDDEKGPRDGDLEEFRKELADEGAGESDEALRVKEGDEKEVAAPLPEDEKEGADRLTEEDLEEFRRQVVDEYGPEGLSEDIPEGQLYNLPKEEMEAGSEGKAESEEGSEAESKGSDSSDKEATSEGGKEAPGSDTTEGKEAGTITGTRDATENPTEQAKPDEEKTEITRETEAPKAVEVHVKNDDHFVITEQTKPSEVGSPGPSEGENQSLQRLQSEGTLAASAIQVTMPGDSEREVGAISKGNATTVVEDKGGTSLPLQYPADGVARYNQEGSQLAMIQQERGPPRESDGAAARAEREFEPTAIRQVVEHMGSPMLVVQGSEFPKDSKENVFAVVLVRENESSDYVLYCSHTPRQQKTYIDLRHIGVEVGEEVRVSSIESLLPQSFAREYNKNPPMGLENTRLVETEGRLSLGIERGELKFDSFALRTREGKAVLDGELVGAGQVKIAKSSEGFDFRLRDHSQVQSIRAEGNSYKFEYRRTTSDRFPHVKLVPAEGKLERLPPEIHKVEMDSAGVRIAKPLDFSTRMVKIELSPSNQTAAWEYWRMASSKSERRVHIGDIGQSVAEITLRKSGFEIVSKEPVGEPIFSRTHISERKGPDLICKKDEQAVLVMVKHWKESYKGLARGEADVNAILGNEKRLAMLEEKIGRGIAGGVAMEIHWSYKEGRGVIYLKYVKSRRA